ncbi:MAG: MerR family transcriptional regulator [Monoglobaceae bacterium]
MNNRYYRIGEVSKITGISKETLHFYSRIGLLVPEYTNPDNGYAYYSHRNLWQLDIISTCRKLSIPLETVKQILSLRNNGEIVKLLMAYRDEAIRLSAYYQQVAEDIIWYREENEHIIEARANEIEITEKYIESEVVIAGDDKENDFSYHANLQNATKNETRYSTSIRRK